MSSTVNMRRKATDDDIIRLNSLGFSLRGIGKELNCHPSSISQRLTKLGVEPTDTRKSFMEGVVSKLSDEQRQWLAESLQRDNYTINQFVTFLIAKEYFDQTRA